MSPLFNIGDIVYLNSGGPPLTVTDIHDADVCVEWFREAVKDSAVFPSAALMKSPDDRLGDRNLTDDQIAKDVVQLVLAPYRRD